MAVTLQSSMVNTWSFVEPWEYPCRPTACEAMLRINGVKVFGEPCVWCGGEKCGVAPSALQDQLQSLQAILLRRPPIHSVFLVMPEALFILARRWHLAQAGLCKNSRLYNKCMLVARG